MEYQKPQIVTTAPALVSIQSSTIKGPFMSTDGADERATSSAYEADE